MINTPPNNNLPLNNKFQRYIGEFEGYACKFSPFVPNMIAACFSQYYGFIGNGRISIFNQNTTTGILEETRRFNTNNAVFDIAWSEVNENQLISAGGDGCLKLWDLAHPNPLLSIQDHSKEIWGVSWNHITTNLAATGGTDTTVKISDLQFGKTVSNLAEHKGVVYGVTWHPTISTVLASASADRTVKLWDMKSPKAIKSLVGQGCEILSSDFSKYENVIALAGADGTVYIYDLRGGGEMPLLVLNGHKLTVRKVMYSPSFPSILGSVSYDMNVTFWDTKKCAPVNVFKHHREFVYGLDFSVFDNKRVTTTGWDNSLYVFNWDESFTI